MNFILYLIMSTVRVMYIFVTFFFLFLFIFFFKQKTAYEMRISDWSSDVCSSDLLYHLYFRRNWDRCTGKMNSRSGEAAARHLRKTNSMHKLTEIGRASCRERVCQYV